MSLPVSNLGYLFAAPQAPRITPLWAPFAAPEAFAAAETVSRPRSPPLPPADDRSVVVDIVTRTHDAWATFVPATYSDCDCAPCFNEYTRMPNHPYAKDDFERAHTMDVKVRSGEEAKGAAGRAIKYPKWVEFEPIGMCDVAVSGVFHGLPIEIVLHTQILAKDCENWATLVRAACAHGNHLASAQSSDDVDFFRLIYFPGEAKRIVSDANVGSIIQSADRWGCPTVLALCDAFLVGDEDHEEDEPAESKARTPNFGSSFVGLAGGGTWPGAEARRERKPWVQHGLWTANLAELYVYANRIKLARLTAKCRVLLAATSASRRNLDCLIYRPTPHDTLFAAPPAKDAKDPKDVKDPKDAKDAKDAKSGEPLNGFELLSRDETTAFVLRLHRAYAMRV